MSSPSPNAKRKLHRTREEESISPPPLKRKLNPLFPLNQVLAVSVAQNEQKATQENRFEIISWNINGIQHLLPPLSSTSRPISSFFSRPTKLKGEVSPQGQTSTSEPSILRKNVENEHSPLRTFLKRHKYPPMLCLQEVKLSPSDTSSQNVLKEASNPNPKNKNNENEPRYEAIFSLPRDKFNARGLGGRQKVHGVCTLIRADLLDSAAGADVGADVGDDGTEDRGGRVKHQETKGVNWDTEGRVLVSTFTYSPSPTSSSQVKNNNKFHNESDFISKPDKLVVINSYWPNGTTYDWKDSLTGDTIGTRHDAKRHFHTKMLSLANSYQSQDYHVVLIGDMNIALSTLDGYPNLRLGDEHVKNRADFKKKFLDATENYGFKGVDSFRAVHGSERKYSYHGEKAEEWGRSCDRVDLGIVSQSIIAKSWQEGEDVVGEYGKKDKIERNEMRLAGAEIYESIGERGGSDHVPVSVILAL